jgi:uncharacterized protein (DUF1330 family)
MAVYQVAIVKIENRTSGLMEYVKKSAEIVAKYGAEYLVRGPADTVLEGEYLQGRAVIVSRNSGTRPIIKPPKCCARARAFMT